MTADYDTEADDSVTVVAARANRKKYGHLDFWDQIRTLGHSAFDFLEHDQQDSFNGFNKWIVERFPYGIGVGRFSLSFML